MADKLIIITKIKKTIDYLEKVIKNYPHSEIVLKRKIEETSYDLLELVYKANIHKEITYMKDAVVKIRLIEYYIKKSLEKKIISYKKFENIGSYLIEINKMINVWAKNEKKNQYI